MISKHYLFPEFYIAKIPMCDDCKIQLQDDNLMLATQPPQWQYSCPKCGKLYSFYEKDLRGEWKFKTI